MSGTCRKLFKDNFEEPGEPAKSGEQKDPVPNVRPGLYSKLIHSGNHFEY